MCPSAPTSRARAVSRVGRPGDDLGQHRVVVGPDDGAHGQRAVHPDAGAGRLEQPEHGAGLRQEAAGRVLGVEPCLDGVPVEGDVALVDRQPLPRRDPDLLLDQVHAGDELGDRVLDLQPGVHLQEEEVARPVGVDDELDRAGAGVADGLGRLDRRPAHGGAHRGVEQRRRRLLDDLLVPALQAALALAEVDHVAVRVAEHLHLDVPGVPDVPLDQQGVVAEGVPWPRGGPRRSRRAARSSPGTTRMPLPPPPALGLSSTGNPTATAASVTWASSMPGSVRPGTTGTPAAITVCLARILSAIASIAAIGGPMKTIAGLLAGAGELDVLRQEPVAGVDGLGAGALRPPRAPARSTGSSARPGPARWGRRRRRAGCAARRRRRRCARPPTGCPSRGACGSPGRRSRPGWRRALSRTSRSPSPRLSYRKPGRAAGLSVPKVRGHMRKTP